MWTRRIWLTAALLGLYAVCATPARADQTESALAKIAKAGELRAGWANQPPYAFRDNTGKLGGFSIDYIDEMGKALNVKVTWVESTWANLVAGLAADKYEIIINVNRTFPRLQVAAFTEPIAVTQKGFLIRKADRQKFRTPADLHDAKVRAGTTIGDAASVAFAAMFPEPQKIQFPGSESILALAAGKVDVVPSDMSWILAAAKEQPDLMVPPESAWLLNDYGMFVKLGDQIWLNWVNWFVRESKMSGFLERLIKKWDIPGLTPAKY
jgi:ABC-type amino acid transport substrate-binding protein